MKYCIFSIIYYFTRNRDSTNKEDKFSLLLDSLELNFEKENLLNPHKLNFYLRELSFA